MDPLSDAQEFGKRVRSARGYLGLSRSDFAKLLGYTGDSTIDRAERGDIGKKRNNPEGRRAFAEEIVRKTGAPAELLGLTESADAEILRRLEAIEAVVGIVPAELTEEDPEDVGAELPEIDRADREFSGGASPVEADIAEQSS